MEYISSIIIGLIIIGAVALIVRSMIKSKKSGKSVSCGCGCESCAMSGHCHGTGNEKKN